MALPEWGRVEGNWLVEGGVLSFSNRTCQVLIHLPQRPPLTDEFLVSEGAIDVTGVQHASCLDGLVEDLSRSAVHLCECPHLCF